MGYLRDPGLTTYMNLNRNRLLLALYPLEEDSIDKVGRQDFDKGSEDWGRDRFLARYISRRERNPLTACQSFRDATC